MMPMKSLARVGLFLSCSWLWGCEPPEKGTPQAPPPPSAAPTSQAAMQFRTVHCEGYYTGHLQGLCTNDRDAIFWSFTDVLVRTDLNGKLAHRISVASHHGDLCFHDGKVYVAVNLGKFNEPPGQADSWVYVYDADTLKELARHRLPGVVHGAGGMGYHDGRFIVVGGLPKGVNENYVYEYNEQFTFQRRYTLPSGYTQMGIQTAAFAAGHWWFGCYGTPPLTLQADASFTQLSKWGFDCSLGVVGLPDGRLLVGRQTAEGDAGYSASAQLASIDAKLGPQLIRPSQPHSPSPSR